HARFYRVVRAKKRGRLLRCAGCGQTGATIGCHTSACKRSYHYACALLDGWTFGPVPDARGKSFLCHDHRPAGQTSPLKGKGKERKARLSARAEAPGGGSVAAATGPSNGSCPCDRRDKAVGDAVVECARCQTRFHPGCTGLSDAEIAKLAEGSGDGWECGGC
ncbi:unnamed protein product, partial [Phaeothamnion confervicola]